MKTNSLLNKVEKSKYIVDLLNEEYHKSRGSEYKYEIKVFEFRGYSMSTDTIFVKCVPMDLDLEFTFDEILTDYFKDWRLADLTYKRLGNKLTGRDAIGFLTMNIRYKEGMFKYMDDANKLPNQYKKNIRESELMASVHENTLASILQSELGKINNSLSFNGMLETIKKL